MNLKEKLKNGMEWKKLRLPIMQNIYKKFRIFRMNTLLALITPALIGVNFGLLALLGPAQKGPAQKGPRF